MLLVARPPTHPPARARVCRLPLEVRAICQSSHLTSFALEDFANITLIVEDRVATVLGNIQGLAETAQDFRIEDMNP